MSSSQLDLGTGSARFDPNLDAHHHLVCDACGAVRDVDVDASHRAACRRPSLDGFSIETTEIVFRGVCADCARRRADHDRRSTAIQSNPPSNEEPPHG